MFNNPILLCSSGQAAKLGGLPISLQASVHGFMTGWLTNESKVSDACLKLRLPLPLGRNTSEVLKLWVAVCCMAVKKGKREGQHLFLQPQITPRPEPEHEGSGAIRVASHG